MNSDDFYNTGKLGKLEKNVQYYDFNIKLQKSKNKTLKISKLLWVHIRPLENKIVNLRVSQIFMGIAHRDARTRRDLFSNIDYSHYIISYKSEVLLSEYELRLLLEILEYLNNNNNF